MFSEKTSQGRQMPNDGLRRKTPLLAKVVAKVRDNLLMGAQMRHPLRRNQLNVTQYREKPVQCKRSIFPTL